MEPEQRPRPTATEVRNNYGVSAVFLVIWVIWCTRDGWFRPDYEHITFSRVMAIVSTPILIFCLIMAASAQRTLMRQRAQPKPADSNPPPPESV
jgi:hypothetical protein